MIRLLGILVGSAVAVGVLIVFVGIPEFPDEPTRPTRLQAAESIDPEPERQPIANVIDSVELDATSDEVLELIPSETSNQSIVEAASVAEATDVTEVAAVELPESLAEETHWYAFWSPFRSEFAANGFVTQLQRTTGLDYRVIKQKPGVYEVAFAYSDDADAELKLAQISAATGLDLPES